MKYLPKLGHLQAFRQVARSGSIRSAPPGTGRFAARIEPDIA